MTSEGQTIPAVIEPAVGRRIAELATNMVVGVRITRMGARPVTEIAYWRARRGGGTETARLPVVRIGVSEVPAGCDAILVAGDLQGVAPAPWGGPPELLGTALADYLPIWAAQGLVPDPGRIVVVLAGDLYSSPGADCRGASGAVDEVWWAFAAAGCPLVVGVAGNHDTISSGDLHDLGSVARLLDGDWIDFGGVRFAGVGGVVGNPIRAGRRSRQHQIRRLDAALASRPSVLVLHEGPPGSRSDQPGSALIGAHVGTHPVGLTVCGHVSWHAPTSCLGDRCVLNVDGRAVLLTPTRPG